MTDSDMHNPQEYLAHAATSDGLQSDREEAILAEFLDGRENDFHHHDGKNGKPSKNLNNIVYYEVELSHKAVRRHVDAVVFYGGTDFYLVEVKDSLDDETLGQLLVREQLFRNTDPLHHFSPVKMAVVTDADDEMARMVEDRYDVRVRTVDRGL